MDGHGEAGKSLESKRSLKDGCGWIVRDGSICHGNDGETILLVDDAVSIRNSQKDILKKHGYIIVGEATNGIEAVELYKEHKPALVIMDIVMPEMDGMLATQEIINFDANAKIIMCSAIDNYLRETTMSAARQVGALDFVVKPFTDEALLEKVESVISLEHFGQNPSPGAVKALVPSYQRAKTQDELQSTSNNTEKSEAVDISLKRVLPDDCDWIVSDTIVSYEDVDERMIDVEKKKFIEVNYSFKTGYFNPWLQHELFDMYFRKVGGYYRQGIDQREGGLGITRYWIPSHSPFNTEWKQSIGISVLGLVKANTMYEADTECKVSFLSLAQLVETYLISGFDPGKKVLDKLRLKYEPTKIVMKSITIDLDGHGRHEVEGDYISIYNKDNLLLYDIEGQCYPSSIFEFVKKINKNIEIVDAHKERVQDELKTIVEIVKNQEALADIVLNRGHLRDWQVRVEVVKKITDQKLLTDIAMNGDILQVRTEAVKRLTNQELLADVAMNCRWVCAEAVKRLTNQELLADVAINSIVSEARAMAIKRLTNQELIADVAMSNIEYRDRIRALEKIADKTLALELLAEMAKDEDAYKVYSSYYDVPHSPFNDGLAAVSFNGKWGYVNSEGKEVIPLSYDMAGKFQDGIAVVRIGKKCGFINKAGNTIIPIEYDIAINLGAGIVTVSSEGTFGEHKESDWDRGHGHFPYCVSYFTGTWDCIDSNREKVIVSSVYGKVILRVHGVDFIRRPPEIDFIRVHDGYVYVGDEKYSID